MSTGIRVACFIPEIFIHSVLCESACLLLLTNKIYALPPHPTVLQKCTITPLYCQTDKRAVYVSHISNNYENVPSTLPSASVTRFRKSVPKQRKAESPASPRGGVQILFFLEPSPRKVSPHPLIRRISSSSSYLF